MSKQAAQLILLLWVSAAAGCHSAATREISDFGQRVADLISGNTAERDVLRMEDRDFADERRVGINRLVRRHYGKGEIYTERYAQIARMDEDPLVRATAIRALNRARDASATDVLVDALSDEVAMVRLEAAKALANLPDDSAVARLTELMRDQREEIDIRIAAAEALRHYPSLEVARALAAMLQERHFSIAWQARRSLVTLTGSDFQFDEPAWLRYLTSNQMPFAA